MKTTVLKFVVLLCCSSCQNQFKKGNASNDIRASSVTKPKRVNTDTISFQSYKVDTVAVTSKKQIIGTWRQAYKEQLTVKISNTQFTYKEHHESYRYIIDKDSIHIFFTEETVTGKLYQLGDTLLINSPNGGLKYVRHSD